MNIFLFNLSPCRTLHNKPVKAKPDKEKTSKPKKRKGKCAANIETRVINSFRPTEPTPEEQVWALRSELKMAFPKNEAHVCTV